MMNVESGGVQSIHSEQLDFLMSNADFLNTYQFPKIQLEVEVCRKKKIGVKCPFE